MPNLLKKESARNYICPHDHFWREKCSLKMKKKVFCNKSKKKKNHHVEKRYEYISIDIILCKL